ncbi:unnamed protein product [Symbiodinium sp. KB8]|nr:unnamed protein product [Symbiodinium sp. KB8]
MWECMTSETRKGRHLLSHCSRQASQAKEAERLSDVERSALIFQLHGVGVRREKTSLLEKMRASARQKRALPVPTGEDTSASSSPGEKLSELYQRASQDISSLASRLAQHNGLRQFSATFSNRAPPLELRMLLPELEASIEQQLQSLQSISNEIAQLEFPDQSRMDELKGAAAAPALGLFAHIFALDLKMPASLLKSSTGLSTSNEVVQRQFSTTESDGPFRVLFNSINAELAKHVRPLVVVQVLEGIAAAFCVFFLQFIEKKKGGSETCVDAFCSSGAPQAGHGFFDCHVNGIVHRCPLIAAECLAEKAKDKPLYGPEGSAEGKVDPNTHKAHTEHKLNQDLNAGMNRGAAENNGIERPPWYTKEWPKDCQYNSPGCTLDDMETSAHKSDIHKDMVRASARWHDALAPGVQSMRFSFLQATDEDLAEVIEKLKGNEDVTELDLSHNHIKDAGIQALVAALSSGAAPKLRELKVYSNEFGKLGETMLTQGLPIFRKNLQVQWKEPSWAKIVREEVSQAKAGTAAPPAA